MTETVAAQGLESHIADWRPAPVSLDDELSLRRVEEFAATMNLDQLFAVGSPLPLRWHWTFFLDWPRTDALGADGHPRDGRFLPPIPNRRRMFAGGRLTVESELVIEQPARRDSEIVSATVKHGRSGEMLFVTVRSRYTQSGRPCITEEQDLVYRSDDGAATAHVRADTQLGVTTAPWSSTPVADAPLLFRFSALTGNAHRIHYDEAYTTGVEGYPGLVVHGPLLALHMAELVRANASDRRIREFQFRLSKPVFLGDAIRVEGTPAAESVNLAVVSGAGTVHASANAVLA